MIMDTHELNLTEFAGIIFHIYIAYLEVFGEKKWWGCGQDHKIDL